MRACVRRQRKDTADKAVLAPSQEQVCAQAQARDAERDLLL